MAKPTYPFISTEVMNTITTLSQQVLDHDDYLNQKACPYDDITKMLLRRLLKLDTPPVEVDRDKLSERKIETAELAVSDGGRRGPKIKAGGVDLEAVTTEIEEIRSELRTLKLDSKALPTGDKIQIIKTRAALVEKLITMAERCLNMKQQSRFMTTVIGILDDLVPQDERVDFMKRLEPFVD